MSNLFKKVACFTDIHLGLKGNSLVHLRDCEDYIDWFIKEAKDAGCDTCISLGDYHHNRNSINLVTLDASIRCLEKLGKAFDQFFWFPGNHDLFYKDKRDVHSTSFGKHIPGVTVIEKTLTVDDVSIVPWLVGDEWKTISKSKSRYMFGHFELPLFFMNSAVQMPDHGELQSSHLVQQEYVFSGHFHKRQNQNNIWYIGNAFPHNFSDTWDDERGMMILEWGGVPEFRKWNDAPKFRNIKLSKLIDEQEQLLKSKMYLRVELDIDVSYEEANFLKENFMENYDIREISLIQEKSEVDNILDNDSSSKFETVDQIVEESIVNISSDQFNQKTLLEIYKNL